MAQQENKTLKGLAAARLRIENVQLEDAKFAKPAISYNDFIPDSVYEKLPTMLREVCSIFLEKRERDIFLTGALTVFSGCFPNLYAVNSVENKKVTPNLLSFIIAPPASGKGALGYSRRLMTSIKQFFEETNQNGHILIPANISTAGLVEILDQNGGAGVMIESEIDTLVIANKQDWGNYSDLLRKSFENEPYSLYRKKNSTYIEVNEVKFSFAVSGTFGQFKSLMKSSENGLFSRGCYYIFEDFNENLKVFGRLSTRKDIVDQFAEYAETAKNYFQLMLETGLINVTFSEADLLRIQNALNPEFQKNMEVKVLQGCIIRSAIIIQKIATVLECLFRCESSKLANTLICSEISLNIAIDLGLLYLNHAYKAFKILPAIPSNILSVNEQTLLDALPTGEFTRSVAIDIGESVGIKSRAIASILKSLVSLGLLKQPVWGRYIKK